jgi:hypothetical protein
MKAPEAANAVDMKIFFFVNLIRRGSVGRTRNVASSECVCPTSVSSTRKTEGWDLSPAKCNAKSMIAVWTVKSQTQRLSLFG